MIDTWNGIVKIEWDVSSLMVRITEAARNMGLVNGDLIEITIKKSDHERTPGEIITTCRIDGEWSFNFNEVSEGPDFTLYRLEKIEHVTLTSRTSEFIEEYRVTLRGLDGWIFLQYGTDGCRKSGRLSYNQAEISLDKYIKSLIKPAGQHGMNVTPGRTY